MEIYVDDETKLTLHGLQQYYIKLAETEKNRKLNDLLDLLDFNQASGGGSRSCGVHVGFLSWAFIIFSRLLS